VLTEPCGWVGSVCVSCFEVLTLSLNKQHIGYKGEYALAQLIEGLRYKPEGRGFDSGGCQRDFSLT
jgi:hypothetical protein